MADLFCQSTWSIFGATVIGLPLLITFFKFLIAKQASIISVEDHANRRRSQLSEALTEALPDSVFFAEHPAFGASTNSYWSKQQREIVPESIVSPKDEHEVSTAIAVIKREYDECYQKGATLPTFAVRSGGHSTVPGASNTANGVVVDLSLFNQVVVSEDGKSVTIGCGARWADVSRFLDSKGLAVAGGRNSDVGVGGLTLGGGFSFFSPRVGFVCDNVLEYRVVLASSTIVRATKTNNADLWRALKGGGNNFGVVTKFVVRCFPTDGVWSGFLYMFSSKAPQVLDAFHNFIERHMDEHAAGPLACFSYVQNIGMQAIATQLIYTKPKEWPSCWQEFKRIGRIWSTNKIRSLTSATDELDGISPAGFRQLHITTTVTNDKPTLDFTHTAYTQAIAPFRKVKGMVWTLVLQPLPASTMHQSKDNVLGLSDREGNLVIVLFTAVWIRKSDDELVITNARAAIDNINNFATERGASDKFRYMNWCDETQQPFQSYGEANLKYLKKTRQAYDPDSFFQKGCVGGFKLGD